MTTVYDIQVRQRVTVNTDPQRRCYDGCNFSEETYWSNWTTLYFLRNKEEAEKSVRGWRNYNRDREYRAVERQLI